MKFACPSCATRYAIADERVPDDTVLKYTCQKCQTVFRFKAQTGGAAPEVRSDIGGDWHVLVDGEQRGPLGGEQLLDLFRSAQITAETYAWRDGMEDWLPISEISDLSALAEEGVEGTELDADAVSTVESPFSAKEAAPEQQETRSGSMTRDRLGTAQISALAGLYGASTGDNFRRGTLIAGQDTSQFEGNEAEEPPEEELPALRGPMAHADYLDQAPGEATQMFMGKAGIYKRRRNQKIGAAVGIAGLIGLIVLVVADFTGAIEVPGAALVYEVTGMEDPNVDRAIERGEEQLSKSDLSDAEKDSLRRKLLGLKEKRHVRGTRGRRRRPEKPQIGIEEEKTMDAAEAAIFAGMAKDERKQEKTITLKSPAKIQTPNLPDGLNQEAIFKVINDSYKGISLCMTKAMKAGERLEGKMEVEMTIVATGKVSQAKILTGKFKGSTIGECTATTIKRWRFPKFNGEPVPVVFPVVLSAGF